MGPSTLPSSWAAPTPPRTAARLRLDHRSAASASVTGKQRATGHALDQPPDDEDVEVGGHGRDHRAHGETGKAGLQQQFSSEPVRRPAQQRHRRDVAEQIDGDDGRHLLDLVNGDTDVTHDVGHDRDHDIGVESTEQHRKAARGDRDPPARGHRLCGFGRSLHQTAGLLTVTGLPQSDMVIVTLWPWAGSILTWLSS